MKITRRDLGVIMILAGILIAFITYKMSFETTLEEIDALQAEQAKLSAEIEELKPLQLESEKWEKEKKRMAEGIDKMMKEFSSDIWQEDNIMSVVDMLDNLETKIPSFSASEAASIKEVKGQGTFDGVTYTLASAGISLSYVVDSYDDMKEFLNYIYRDEDRKRVFSSVTMAFESETGKVAGSASIKEYVLTDGVRPYEPVELPDDNYGIENDNSNSIFGEPVGEEKDIK